MSFRLARTSSRVEPARRRMSAAGKRGSRRHAARGARRDRDRCAGGRHHRAQYRNFARPACRFGNPPACCRRICAWRAPPRCAPASKVTVTERSQTDMVTTGSAARGMLPRTISPEDVEPGLVYAGRIDDACRRCRLSSGTAANPHRHRHHDRRGHSGRRMMRRDTGSALVEALIGSAIVALTLAPCTAP